MTPWLSLPTPVRIAGVDLALAVPPRLQIEEAPPAYRRLGVVGFLFGALAVGVDEDERASDELDRYGHEINLRPSGAGRPVRQRPGRRAGRRRSVHDSHCHAENRPRSLPSFCHAQLVLRQQNPDT